MAQFQGTRFELGDILIVRSGYTDQLLGRDVEEQKANLSTGQAVGLASTQEMARWIWNHHFAAVAGDMPALEALPPQHGGVENLGK